jgi:hypothetical protein
MLTDVSMLAVCLLGITCIYFKKSKNQRKARLPPSAFLNIRIVILELGISWLSLQQHHRALWALS